MKFYDLCLRSNLCGGTSSVEELARYAELLGYSGIVVCDVWQGPEKLATLKAELARVQTQTKVELLLGAEISANTPSELSTILDSVRPQVAVVAVNGGTFAINQAACNDSRVDMLLHPELSRPDPGLDEACIAAAARNGVSIALDFRQVLYSYRRQRSALLQRMTANVKLAIASRAPLVVVSSAQSVWDMRDPRELIALASVLGLDFARSFATLSDAPARIVERRTGKPSVDADPAEVLGEEKPETAQAQERNEQSDDAGPMPDMAAKM
jgi:ribonuclease P/MRP protein subunit RPP1